MRVRIILAILACKSMRIALRILRRGGTALPGKVAMRLCPDLLRYLAKGVKCVAITGTNGKTTCSRMLEQVFIDSSAAYFSNKSGSNLMQGITAEFALNATITGKPKRKYAIIECDEGASKKVFEYIDPAAVLVTNVFSDQLDRFGNVGATLEKIKSGVKNAPNAVVCLNADDSLVSSIADGIPNKVIYFGVGVGVLEGHKGETSDAPSCIRCATPYEYDYATYGHLGGFRCPNCGYARRHSDITVTGLIARDADSQTVRIDAFGEITDVTINIPGDYNIYNAAGMIAASTAMGFSIDDAKGALLRFELGFGRMEKLVLNGRNVRMILVKNPVGCNQALNYLCGVPGDILLVVCLNDRIADGTDVSWIHEANFEMLIGIGERLRGVFVCGTRSEDMAQRLRTAGIPEDIMRVFADERDVLEAALVQDSPVCILPTYTAMLELRGIMHRRYGIKEFWE